MLARTKRWTITTILAVAAFAIAGGAALAGGAAARGTAAAAPPVAGKACTKAGATGTAKRGVKLVCTKAAKSKKPLWVAARQTAPAKPTAPARPTTPATPATATTSSSTGGASADLIAKGKDLFLNGAGSQGIACARCHGANALGDTAPKVVGKKESEIRTAVSTVAVMAPFFGDLSNDQISAIAAYLQSLAK